MTPTLLGSIQKTVMKYAEVISNVIHIDVEIVDDELQRIAGTGLFANAVNTFSVGVVYAHVLESGEKSIIKNPRKHSLCQNCPEKNSCNETMEISSPIFYKGKTIGVIGLVCTTAEQKDFFTQNLEAYIKFLENISELISAKLYENTSIQRNLERITLFNKILNSIDNGVLIISEIGEIQQINQPALKQLQLTEAIIGENVHIKETNEYILGGQNFEIHIQKKIYHVIGQVIPVFPILDGNGKIILFKRIKEVKSSIIDYASVRNNITLDAVIGNSPAMEALKNKIQKISNTRSTVLITGESGTGKELIARAIHQCSNQNTQPFIGINCAAIPDTLLESELFGYVRGAFSGANPNGRMGKFELANKGIIFLDEIGDMPLYLQSKILRVLQERTLTRIGSNQSIKLDIRVIAATNKNLKQMVQNNEFREDLYYRINVIPLELPPLRKRENDFILILQKLTEKYNQLLSKNVHTYSPQAMEYLQAYPWPGNVRELENAIELMINLSDERGIIDTNVLPQNILQYYETKGEKSISDISTAIVPLKDWEKTMITRALKTYGTDTKGKKETARQLQIGLATLYRKIREYGLEDNMIV